MTQKYDAQFKINAVQLYHTSGKTIDALSSDLGISRASLGQWINQYKRDGTKSFPGSGHVVNEELQALKRELQIVRQECDILKKAIAIFSETRVGRTHL